LQTVQFYNISFQHFKAHSLHKSMTFLGLKKPGKKSAVKATKNNGITKPRSLKKLSSATKLSINQGSKASLMSYTKLSSRDDFSNFESTSQMRHNATFDNIEKPRRERRGGSMIGFGAQDGHRPYVGGFAADAYEAARADFMAQNLENMEI